MISNFVLSIIFEVVILYLDNPVQDFCRNNSDLSNRALGENRELYRDLLFLSTCACTLRVKPFLLPIILPSLSSCLSFRIYTIECVRNCKMNQTYHMYFLTDNFKVNYYCPCANIRSADLRPHVLQQT